jgi:hypothetical protein
MDSIYSVIPDAAVQGSSKPAYIDNGMSLKPADTQCGSYEPLRKTTYNDYGRPVSLMPAPRAAGSAADTASAAAAGHDYLEVEEQRPERTEADYLHVCSSVV